MEILIDLNQQNLILISNGNNNDNKKEKQIPFLD